MVDEYRQEEEEKQCEYQYEKIAHNDLLKFNDHANNYHHRSKIIFQNKPNTISFLANSISISNSIIPFSTRRPFRTPAQALYLTLIAIIILFISSKFTAYSANSFTPIGFFTLAISSTSSTFNNSNNSCNTKYTNNSYNTNNNDPNNRNIAVDTDLH
ncbi:hypothetical protein BGX24_006861 [Mortierella sp. AD032]|nr:hypothetical protein BGX24_006861 [Mortierella sp. AD032]